MSDKGNGVELATAYVSLTVAMQNQWKTISAEIHKGVEDGAKKARAALEGELAKAKLGGGFGASVEGEAKTGARRARRQVQDQLDGVNADGLGDKIVGAAKKAAQQARRQLESDLGTIVVNARGDASVAQNAWSVDSAGGVAAPGGMAASALGAGAAISAAVADAQRQIEVEMRAHQPVWGLTLDRTQVLGEIGSVSEVIDGRLAGWKPSIGERISEAVRSGVDAASGWVDRLQSRLDSVQAPEFEGTLMAGATLVGVGQVLRRMKNLTDVAGQLQQTQSGLNVLIGAEGTKALSDWAQGADESAGMSERLALESGRMFAVFGRQAGMASEEIGRWSAQMAQFAGDMDSSFDFASGSAVQALLAGFRGESEPLSRYGADVRETALRETALREGIIETSRALTQRERILAVQATVFEQLDFVQGDFVRNGQDLSNQQKELAANWENLKTQMGEGLAPAAVSITGALNGVVSGLMSADPWLVKTGAQVGGMATLAVGAVAGINLMTAAWVRYRAAALASTRVPVIGAGPLAAIGLTVTAGVAMRNAMSEATKELVSDVEELNAAIDAADFEKVAGEMRSAAAVVAEGPQPDDIVGKVVKLFTDGPAMEQERFKESLDALRDSMLALDEVARNAAIDEYAAKLQAESPAAYEAEHFGYKVQIEEWREELNAAAQDTAALNVEQAELPTTLDQVTTALERQSARLKALSIDYQAGDAAAAAFRGSIEASTRMDDQMDAGLALGSAVKALNEGLFGQAKATGKVASASDLAQRATTRLSDAVANADGRLAGARIRMEALAAGASTFRQAMADATPWDDQINATLDLGDAFEQMRKQSRRLPAQFDANRASLGRYTQEERTALRSVTSLAAASADYLGTLIETGRGNNVVRSEAARMRGEIERQLRAIGMNEESVRGYVNTLGLMPDQVETAIKLSGAEQARFRLQTYLSLLEGKIPAELATKVAAQVEAGNLDGAASTLAKFAATNPVRLDVEVSDESVAKAADKMSLPDVYSPLKAALGQYNDEQMRGLEALSKLGDATSNYLATLVADGKFDEAREQAALLRGEYSQQLGQIVSNEDALNDYIEILGLTPDQVETAINLSGEEMAITKIRLYSDLLGDEIPDEVKTEVLTLLDNGSVVAASQGLTNWRLGEEKKVVRLKAIIETPVGQGYDGALFNAARSRIPGRATGGPVQPGRDYWVGEEGPEIVRFPAAGQVIPADVSASIARNGTSAASGAAVYNLSVTQVTDAASAPSAFVAELRRLEGERR